MRSKQEKIIADFLYEQGINYEYEPQLRINGKFMRPDFYLPDFDVYIEYWGLANIGAWRGRKYRKRMKDKLRLYKQGDERLISLYEGYSLNKLKKEIDALHRGNP